MRDRRFELSRAAAALYPDAIKVEATPLLSTARWLPGSPLPISGIGLELVHDQRRPAIRGDESAWRTVLPAREDGTRYQRYSGAITYLAAPAMFENRLTYRLRAADLGTNPGRLVFGRGRYFDGIDVGESLGHEYVAGGSVLRTLIGDPCDLHQRPSNLAITVLTMRHDRSTQEASFLVHWRDPAKVGHAGGLLQVVPVGIFQPANDRPSRLEADFDLWRSLLREYSEELLGEPEREDIDYDRWDFGRGLTSSLRAGQVRAFCLGLGVDPLTLATDLLAVVVIEAAVFDKLFGSLVEINAEGRVLPDRLRFDAATVERFVAGEPMQAAAAAVLRLAWRHREQLLAILGR